MLFAILMATVLSPSFGWEASSSRAAHGHEMLALDDCDTGAAHHQGDEDSHHHHGCAGHVLGHLQVELGHPFVLSVLDLAGSALPAPASDFSSFLPQRLDRPPRASVLA